MIEVGYIAEVDEDEMNSRYLRHWVWLDRDLNLIQREQSDSISYYPKQPKVGGFGGDLSTGYESGTFLGELEPSRSRTEAKFHQRVVELLHQNQRLCREILDH